MDEEFEFHFNIYDESNVNRRRAERPRLMGLNEVNTLPGFTSISMYPKLWEASGLPQTDLMDRLIAHGLARHARRRALSSE